MAFEICHMSQGRSAEREKSLLLPIASFLLLPVSQAEALTEKDSVSDLKTKQTLRLRSEQNIGLFRLSGGVAVIQVGAQTETELKEKKLRVEDALNATKVSFRK